MHVMTSHYRACLWGISETHDVLQPGKFPMLSLQLFMRFGQTLVEVVPLHRELLLLLRTRNGRPLRKHVASIENGGFGENWRFFHLPCCPKRP